MIQNLISIEELVEDKFFKIPDYQRGYSWEKDQLHDLIKDIEHIRGKNHKHYTGTVVITKDTASGKYHIVDGQQRITSLIILMKAIFDLNPDRFSEIKGRYLIRKEGYVLETNLETDHYFKEAIIGDKKNLAVEINSLYNLKEAKDYLYKWVEQNSNDIDPIYKTVANKLGFICFAPTNTEEIGIMFEVINNRGKPLSELEKIKNYFIYYSTIHSQAILKDKINQVWGSLLKYLNLAGVTGNDEENRFLRNCYIVFYSSSKSKSWNVYEELKDKYKPEDKTKLDEKIDEIEKFIDFLTEAAQSYTYLFTSGKFKEEYSGPKKSKIDHVLRQLRCHPNHASILPLYLAVMAYVHDKHEQIDEVCQLIEIIEKLNFRAYVLRNEAMSRSDSKQSHLFWLAHSFYWDNEWHTDQEETETVTSFGGKKVEGGHVEWLRMELIEFTKYHSSEEILVRSLTLDHGDTYDFYHWVGLRFFLGSYEEHLNSGRNETWDIDKLSISRGETDDDKRNDHLSREHIWASKNRVEDFPEDYHLKRRLGNFVLIGLRSNIQLQNAEILDKVDYLIKNSLNSMLQVTHLVKYLKEAVSFAQKKRQKRTKYYYSDIAAYLIDARETDLIQFALKRWKLPNERMERFEKVDSFRADEDRQPHNYYLKD